MNTKRIGRILFSVLGGYGVYLLIFFLFFCGFNVYFGPNEKEEVWGLFYWGEHWGLRLVFALLASWCSGFWVGVVSRNNGKPLSLLVSIPIVAMWIVFGVISWKLEGNGYHMSIGNRMFDVLIVIFSAYLALKGADYGEATALYTSESFDARRYSVLGVKWYNFIWLPAYIYLLVVFVCPGIVLFVNFIRSIFKFGPSTASLIPFLATWLIGWTFYMLGIGMSRSYQILAGTSEAVESSLKARAKYFLGYPTLAIGIQSVIMVLLLFIQNK